MKKSKSKSNDDLIEVRGRIYERNPSYERCRTGHGNSVFKTLVSLADEAVMASNRLAQIVKAGHPLHPTLSGMNSTEAITYLLGVTQKYMQQSSALSDKTPTLASDQLKPQLISPMAGARTNDAAGLQGQDLPSVAFELDDETFDAFSSFTGAQA